MIPFLAPGTPFPAASRAMDDPNGLLAAGADLSVSTLVAAYRRGIFPWFSEGDPILWWSPDPRLVLVPEEMHLSHTLRRRLRRADFRVSLDEAFDAVLDACAGPQAGERGTWLVPSMRRAYRAMHRAGYAHSLEVWAEDELVGGVYGVTLGRMIFGESMFSRRSDGSKIALAWLTAQMRRWGCPMLDCQVATDHLRSLGARPLPRADFLRRVHALVDEPAPGWKLDPELDLFER